MTTIERTEESTVIALNIQHTTQPLHFHIFTYSRIHVFTYSYIHIFTYSHIPYIFTYLHIPYIFTHSRIHLQSNVLRLFAHGFIFQKGHTSQSRFCLLCQSRYLFILRHKALLQRSELDDFLFCFCFRGILQVDIYVYMFIYLHVYMFICLYIQKMVDISWWLYAMIGIL